MKINGHTIVIGDRVTVKVREEAYYSRYHGQPECWLEPGEIAVVGAVDVPVVRGREGTTFLCADFQKGGKTWRVALYRKNVRVVAVAEAQGAKA